MIKTQTLWAERETRDAVNLSWGEFHAKWPGRSCQAWRKHRSLVNKRGIEHYISKELPKTANDEELRRLLIRENDALKQALTSRETLESLIVEAVDAHLARIEPFTPPKFAVVKKAKWRPQVAVLCLSDIHAGKLVRPADVGGLGEYNWDILKSRVGVLRDSVIEIKETMPAIPFPELVIHALGDWVTGEDIYVGQGFEIDRDLIDQTFTFTELLAKEFIVPMCQVFPRVTIYAVFGNHGRAGRIGTHHARTNWDYVAYRYLNSRLNKIKNFTAYISEGPFLAYQHPLIPKFTHLLIHGDTVRSWTGVPFYGIERAHAKMMQLTGLSIDYLYVGHHHQAAKIDAAFGQKILNGSWEGADSYSVNRLMAGNQPKQVFCGFNDKRGMTWSFDIHLAPKEKLKADAKGLFTPVYEL